MPDSPGPRITIVTPCLNSVSTLAKALDSVAGQGFNDVEHIVVDGGSTDGTVDLLAARTNVKWISEPDEGLSDAMNKGIAMASGDLIGWLNADDWYLPGAFDAVAAAASRHPDAPWVTGQCVIVDGNGGEIRRGVSKYKNFWLRRYTFGRYLTNNFISCPATFIRSNAYLAAGQYDLAHRFSMDYDMFLRVGRLGDPAIITEDLAVFTMAEGTKSMSGFETQFREHFQIAKAQGRDHRFSVMINLAFSASVIAIYKAMRVLRRVRQGPDVAPDT